MEHVRLGRTGLEVSRICLGCMSYGAPTSGLPGRHARALEEPYVPHPVAGFG